MRGTIGAMKETIERRKGSHAGAMLAVVLLLPVLYVLSIGPAARLVFRGYMQPETVKAIYAPVQWLADQNHAVNFTLTWYVNLWK
jgi:hypothetical protein